MNLTTQQPEGQEPFRSPDLKFRASTALWGPLRISIHHHRQSAELGYQAGEEAYQAAVCSGGQAEVSLGALECLMSCYLTTPRFRPRNLTAKILEEWRAMFILGWTQELMAERKADGV